MARRIGLRSDCGQHRRGERDSRRPAATGSVAYPILDGAVAATRGGNARAGTRRSRRVPQSAQARPGAHRAPEAADRVRPLSFYCHSSLLSLRSRRRWPTTGRPWKTWTWRMASRRRHCSPPLAVCYGNAEGLTWDGQGEMPSWRKRAVNAVATRGVFPIRVTQQAIPRQQHIDSGRVSPVIANSPYLGMPRGFVESAVNQVVSKRFPRRGPTPCCLVSPRFGAVSPMGVQNLKHAPPSRRLRRDDPGSGDAQARHLSRLLPCVGPRHSISRWRLAAPPNFGISRTIVHLTCVSARSSGPVATRSGRWSGPFAIDARALHPTAGGLSCRISNR